jgi:hypothetical protein
MVYKGAGIYDDEDFSFIESCNNLPDEIEIGTCWIGDEKTFNEIINNWFPKPICTDEETFNETTEGK